MMERGNSDGVLYPFHYSTMAVTLLAVFVLSILMMGAPWTAALISLACVVMGFAKMRVPGRVRAPFQKSGLSVAVDEGKTLVSGIRRGQGEQQVIAFSVLCYAWAWPNRSCLLVNE